MNSKKDSPISILDLGAGRAKNFIQLLKKYPNLHYVGVEPRSDYISEARKNLTSLNGQVIDGRAEVSSLEKWLKQKFDIVTSFSVFEHVYKRREYLLTAKHFLKPGGHFIINYDLGHFHDPDQQFVNTAGRLLSRLGIQKYYRADVHYQEFIDTLQSIGLRIADHKLFNNPEKKEQFKQLPEIEQEDFMRNWLQWELDNQNEKLYTHNFIATH